MIENPVIEQQTDKTWLRQKDIAKKGWHENDYTIPPKLGNKILSQK